MLKITKNVLGLVAVAFVLLNRADGVVIDAVAGLGVNGPGTTGGVNAGATTSGYDVGWEFSISSPITVTALGKLVDPVDGHSTASSWEVAIYNAGTGGTQVADGTVLSSAPLVPNGIYESQYVSIAPVTLPAGTYDIYSRQNGDNFVYDAFYTPAPGITWLGGNANSGNVGALPSTNPAYEIAQSTPHPFEYVGPLFQITAVPEPSTLALAILGAIGGFAAVSRRRRSAR